MGGWIGSCVLVGACLLVSGTGCSSPRTTTDAEPRTFGTEVPDPERLGWSAEGLEEIRRQAESLGSAALLIVTGGETVLAQGDLTRNLRAHSMRKSFLSALYGIAVEDGQIDLMSTLAELGIDEKTPLTDSERQATVGDLLSARSGVYLPAASEVASIRENRPERHQYAPGTHWYYNNWDFNVLGTIYRQETGEDLFEAFERRIAAAIGMQDHDLDAMRYQYEDVSVHPSYKFRISTRDLARFGLLYLKQGVWDGVSVVPRDWVESSIRAHSITGSEGTKSGFGLMWWVVAPSEARPEGALPTGAYTTSGTGGHRLTVLPEIDTVLVLRMDTDRRGSPRIGSSTYDRFLGDILQARLRTGRAEGDHMGAWGHASFDNDDALDWVDGLEECPDLTVLSVAFSAVTNATGQIEAPTCWNALAAAEVVAAMVDGDESALPDEVAAWLKGKPTPDAVLVERAAEAVEAVAGPSELRELWEENEEDYPRWAGVLASLKSRLGEAPG